MYSCLFLDILIYIALKAILSIISFQHSGIVEQGKWGGTLVCSQVVEPCSTIHNHNPIPLLLVHKHTVVVRTSPVQTLVQITQVQDQVNLAHHPTANHNWMRLMKMHMPRDMH